MGILDEAIREHLELKRQHGAGESELKELEDEAFGPPERPGDEESPPDAASEAPTEFMAQPDVGEATEEDAEVADAQPPEPPAEQPHRRREPVPEIADLQEGPEVEEPDIEEAPAMEHEAIRPPEADEQEEVSAEPAPDQISSGPSTEEREAIADQPTELYDVAGEEFAEPAAPSEEELVEEELSEPRLAPVDAVVVDDDVDESTIAGEEDAEEGEEEDDFFDEKRLSDELNQALEAPSEPAPEEGTEPEEDAPAPAGSEEDLLEETPDFLEGAPEDDQLWFEQKPPKDFDFDD